MATDDCFRARLDQMIDLRHPLVVLAGRLPWSQIETALAPAFARKNRSGQVMPGNDLFGTTLEIAGAGVSIYCRIVRHPGLAACPRQIADQYQRAMSRKVKFSNNWKKAKARVQRIHARIGDARRDYLHKTSTTISQNHALVCIEDLQVRNMSRSAAGTNDSPGKNVRGGAG